MVLESRDYTHFTPKHVTNDILKYQVSKMNTKKIGDSRVNRCFPPPEVKNLETRILYHIYIRHEKRRRRADTVCGNFMRMRKFSTKCIEFYTYMCHIVDIYMTFYSERLNIPSEH